MQNFTFGKPASGGFSFGAPAGGAAPAAPAASAPAGPAAAAPPSSGGGFSFGAKPPGAVGAGAPAATTGGFGSVAPSTGTKPSFGGFGGVTGGAAGKPAGELTDEQKAMKLSDVIQHLTVELEQHLGAYTQAVAGVQSSDRDVYGALFQLQQTFTGMASLSDQLNEDYETLARISLEQVQLYEDLQKTAAGLPGNQQIVEAALRLQEVQTKLLGAVVGDTDLLGQIQAQQNVLDEIQKAVGLKPQ